MFDGVLVDICNGVKLILIRRAHGCVCSRSLKVFTDRKEGLGGKIAAGREGAFQSTMDLVS